MKPLTRRETYLNAIANGETNVPDPITREETYLHQIAMNGGSGGGGGGGGGVFLVNMTFDEATNTETLDKTWQEIYDAAQNGLVFLTASSATDLEAKVFDGWLNAVDNRRGYAVTFSEVWVENTSVSGGNITLYAETSDGYPSGSL